jgi:hypothetical protein
MLEQYQKHNLARLGNEAGREQIKIKFRIIMDVISRVHNSTFKPLHDRINMAYPVSAGSGILRA